MSINTFFNRAAVVAPVHHLTHLYSKFHQEISRNSTPKMENGWSTDGRTDGWTDMLIKTGG